MIKNESKTFLVINLSYLGDVLVTNALCQNIKLNYPDSKVVFMVNKPFYEAALNQECVDDVIYYDKKNEHKGILGFFKFLFNCPYKNKIDATIILYANDRGIILSYLLGSKIRISSSKTISKLLVTHNTNDFGEYVSMQDINAHFISLVTGKLAKILPIKYKTCLENDPFASKIKKQFEGEEIIGLCTVGKHIENYLPIKIAIDIIENLNAKGKTVFYFGAGNDCRKYADELKKRGCVKFVDLTNATTISQLANIMKLCQAIISIDTGTLHLAYATQTPVVAVFYQPKMVEKWAPRRFLYENTAVIDKDYSSENILNKTFELIDKSKK